MSFEKPTIDNVKLGDILIARKIGGKYPLVEVSIIKLEEKYLTAKGLDNSLYVYTYDEALILKKDKSFLIGDKVPDYFLKSSWKIKKNKNRK